MHGYSHENPIAMSPEQEEAVLLRCIDLITEVSGQRPRGYVAPWWEFSHVTNELLLKHGIKYDHSLMHRDLSATMSAWATAGPRLTMLCRQTTGCTPWSAARRPTW